MVVRSISNLINVSARRGTSALNHALGRLESLVTPRSDQFLYPPVFIIGAPRSGSTLLYQVLTTAFKFGYLSNLHCKFYKCPYILQRCLGWLISTPRGSSYQSTHGRTEGLLAPSECGNFWYRWFRRTPQYVPLADVDLSELQSLRRTLIGLTQAYGAPLLFKNMPCALRLQPLGTLLPEARFLVIQRDPLWNAQSLLQVREEVFGNYHCWWSMEPPEIEELRKLPPEAQVLEQIHAIYRVIKADGELIGKERFLFLEYESLCQDTRETLRRIESFLSESNIHLKKLHEVPSQFPVSNKVSLPQEQFNKLVQYQQELSPLHD